MSQSHDSMSVLRTHYDDIEFAIDSRYKVTKVLGKGTYGVVCLAFENSSLSNSGSRKIAVKKVMKIFTNETLVKRAMRELRLMRHFRGHRNIITLFDLDMVTQAPYDGLYCYQELMDLDLARVIQGPIELTDAHVQSITYQILCGVKYIHSARVIHRDLKPGNILVNAQGLVKICDFGLARGINEDTESERIKITRYVATRWYRAPELIISQKNYSTSIDMWSVGCIICELLGRRPIFKGRDHLSQLTAITQILGTPPKELVIRIASFLAWDFFASSVKYPKIPFSELYPRGHQGAIDLIEMLLKFDPDTRPNAEDCLSHEYLRPFRNLDDEPVSKEYFDFSFEKLGRHDLERALREEVKSFRREVRNEAGSSYKKRQEDNHSHGRLYRYST